VLGRGGDLNGAHCFNVCVDLARSAERTRGFASSSNQSYSGGPEMAAASAEQFATAAARLESLGGKQVEIDFAPFAEIAAMLYQSSFVAERYSGLHAFLDAGRPAAVEAGTGPVAAAKAALSQQSALFDDQRLLPVTRAIISGSGEWVGGWMGGWIGKGEAPHMLSCPFLFHKRPFLLTQPTPTRQVHGCGRI